MSKEINILQLYPRDMNIYGDWGNILTLIRRLELHGYEPKLTDYNPGEQFPDKVDLVVGGGGQDSGQNIIQNDLLGIADKIHRLVEQNTPMLLICGLYQLFGHRFITDQGQEILGISVFDLETQAGSKRLVGNVIAESDRFGTIVGYENHSGRTKLGNKTEPLATVRLGAGNNGQDQTEGAIYKNAIGSYLHGSLLPKNPAIADFLIEQAVINRYGEFHPRPIDDTLIERVRQITLTRPR